MAYEHLRFSREAPLTERHRRRGFPTGYRPEDPRAFGAELQRKFDEAKQPVAGELGGYDNRILLKVQLHEDAQLPESKSLRTGFSLFSLVAGERDTSKTS